MAPSERNNNMVPALIAKSNAGDLADVVVWADPATHRLLVNASVAISGGSKSNNAAAPTSDNIGALIAVANVAAPSWTEGNQVLLSTDLTGALRVTGSLSVGGATDNIAFTAGTTTGSIVMGFYHSTVDTITDGRSAAIALTSKRSQHVTLHTAAGVETGIAAAPLQVSLANTGANATAVKVDGSAVTQPTSSTAANAKVDIGLINAVVPLMGNGVTGTGSLRVTIASDNTAFAVNAAATLAAETTKVIGTVRNLGNAGAIFDGVNTAATAPANGILGLGIYNSTEPSPTTGQSVGIQLDSKGRQRIVIMDAAGNTRGQNVNANSAAMVAFDQTTVGTTNGVALAQINAATALAGNGATGTGSLRVTLASDNSALPAWGHGATGAAVPAGAQYKGGIAKTANPTAATDGNLTGILLDKLGKQVVVGSIRDLKVNQITTITTSTSETTVLTAVASTFLDVYGCIVTNTSATAVTVAFKDSTTGTTQFNIAVPAGETRGFMLPEGGAIKQTTVNNNWTATTQSVTSVIITMLAVKNI